MKSDSEQPDSKTGKNKRRYRNGVCKYGKKWWICVKYKGKKIEKRTDANNIDEAKVCRDAAYDELKARFTPNAPASQKFLSRFVTLEQAAQLWYADKKGKVAERYREQMLEAVGIHMSEWKGYPVDAVTSDIMSQAVTKYLGTDGKKVLKGKSISVKHTIGGANRLIRLVSALYGWMMDIKKWFDVRPWRHSQLKSQKEQEPVVWTEDIQTFVNKVDDSTSKRIIRLSIRMQIGLGLRETETATADWKWFERRLKTFSPGLTKSKRPRSIPVPPSLYPLLIEEWERQGKPASGHILKYRDEGKPVYRGFTRNAIASAGRKMGIVGLHPHRLRASWATAHHEQGTKIDVIMDMAGHKYESTTRLYILKRSKDATEAQDRVSQAMGFRTSHPLIS